MFELKAVVHRYRAVLAVAVPGWRAGAGEAWLLSGPSGCGKSTVLHILAGLIVPSEGSVMVAGRTCVRCPKARVTAGAAAPSASCRSGSTWSVRSTCATTCGSRRRCRVCRPTTRGSRRCCEAVGVADLAHRFPRELSQGQAQRVAIARAVVNRPALLLADEPTANLDDAHAAQALELLRAQAIEAGATLVVASHDNRVKPSAAVRVCVAGHRCGGRMSLFRLALAYARRRPLSTLLVVVLLAIGVATVTLTLLLAHELEDRLARDAAGIDLVVGAKGSPLQLVLAGVYHVDVPPGNIPLAAIAALRANPLIAQAIPLALGDSFRGFRIVGTEPALVEHYGGVAARRANCGAGRWRRCSAARSRAASGLAVGATFTGSHGLAEGGGEHADAPYRVTGILAPTGTVLDRLVADVDRQRVGGARSPPCRRRSRPRRARQGDQGQAPADEHAEPEPGREVTLALVRYGVRWPPRALPRAINKETELVAASPAYETARLLTVFGVGIDLIRAFALLLMAASGLMLFVALAQALDDRRYDLAILRTLGASRRQVALGPAGRKPGARGRRARWPELALAHLAALFVGAAGCRRRRRWPPPRPVVARGVGGGRRWRWPRVYWPHCGPRGAHRASTWRPRLRTDE